jgi:4-hydroxy-tetrahydrodipicolinate synthase
LSAALHVLSSYDEGPDLVLYYKYLMVLRGEAEYALHFNADDALSASQRGYAEAQLKLFDAWYASWTASTGAARNHAA